MTYAKGTSVSVEKSKYEVDALLAKHGATQRGVMSDDEACSAAIMFTMRGATYRIDVPLPKRDRFARGADQRHAQAVRERWRLVVLALKSKLELVALGGSTIEREFLADLLLPSGHTAHQVVAQVVRMGLSDNVVRMLPPAAAQRGTP